MIINETPPGRLLLRAVRIRLECILLVVFNGVIPPVREKVLLNTNRSVLGDINLNNFTKINK